MKIAVIGAGITGMGCSWALSRSHEVILFEKNAQVGGHSRTIDVSVDNTQVPVDTGFIVFNRPNYPNLTALFEWLNVPVVESKMSFGVSLRQNSFEYGTSGIRGFLGQITNLFRFKFWRMFLDILKFNRSARNQSSEGLTLQQLLDKMNMSEVFRSSYLLPMAASIWSTPSEKMLNYPAESLLRFFENHGLLTLFRQPQWFTVEGGSRQYVTRLMNDYEGEVRTNSDICKVRRSSNAELSGSVEIEFSDGTSERFDKVVFACHADQTLRLLKDTDDLEKSVLESFRFQPNQVVTHNDTKYMPKRRACWSSWIYLDSGPEQEVSLSYWMNNLQPLRTDKPVIVTMNPRVEATSDGVFDQWTTAHPLFDQSAIDAQSRLGEIQGHNNAYFCGAWTGYGFHEDGLRSGLDVAESLGAQAPWKGLSC